MLVRLINWNTLVEFRHGKLAFVHILQSFVDCSIKTSITYHQKIELDSIFNIKFPFDLGLNISSQRRSSSTVGQKDSQSRPLQNCIS